MAVAKKSTKKVVKKKVVNKQTKKIVKAKKTKQLTPRTNLHGLITERAHSMYLERSTHEGDSMSDWLKAEKEISKELVLT